MRTRIGTRLMLGAGLVTSLVIGVMAFLTMRSHADQLLFELTQSANQVSADHQGQPPTTTCSRTAGRTCTGRSATSGSSSRTASRRSGCSTRRAGSCSPPSGRRSARPWTSAARPATCATPRASHWRSWTSSNGPGSSGLRTAPASWASSTPSPTSRHAGPPIATPTAPSRRCWACWT